MMYLEVFNNFENEYYDKDLDQYLKVAFKEFFNREIGNITIDNDKEQYTIFSDDNGELFRIFEYSDHNGTVFSCTIKDNLFFQHRDISKKLRKILDLDYSDNIYYYEVLDVIKELDIETYNKYIKDKNIKKFKI